MTDCLIRSPISLTVCAN
uniref:Uncharacterized protein n=1 Tax=Anguilla anguilla TaxID=7936 RepID=A0A0E9VUA3_ANGAN